MAPPLLIPDTENATIKELKKVLTSLFTRLKSDRANPADDKPCRFNSSACKNEKNYQSVWAQL
jgi:hypothetical protein